MRLQVAGAIGQLVVAVALAVGATLLLQRVGPMAMMTVLMILLTVLFFLALGLARAALLTRRIQRGWQPPRPGGPGRGNGPRPGGPGHGGVREPRRPFPSSMPPRIVTAEPEPAGP